MFATGAHCNVTLAEVGVLAVFSFIVFNGLGSKKDCWVFVNDGIIVFRGRVILLFCLGLQTRRAALPEDWLLAAHRWPTVEFAFRHKLAGWRHLNFGVQMLSRMEWLACWGAGIGGLLL